MASWVKGLLGTQSPENQPSGTEMIEKLRNRVVSSTLLEDRCDAVRNIKGLSKKYRGDVGTMCLDVLVNVVRNDRANAEIVGYAVETIWNIVEVDKSKVESGETDSGVQFSEEFIKNPDNVSLLLDLLEEFDFQVRRPTTCLLTTLLHNKLTGMQEVILLYPNGIARIMDLLSDSREVIRNDGILLLMELTRNNGQIQKIIAFQDAFNHLLAIIRNEGYSDGGIVVQDCLFVLLNLLKGNNSNQASFRESSLIQHIVPFFELKLPSTTGSSSDTWSMQKMANIYHMLRLIRTLVSPSNPQQATASCQKTMNQTGLIGHLCSLMLAGGVSTEILNETIGTVAEVIRGCEINQKFFASVTIPANPPRTAILTLLMSMVMEKQPMKLRLSALYCFQCYLYKNEEGQSHIISTLLPSSTESSFSPGQVLCAGLFGQDTVSNWCTSVAIANALNSSLKPQLLRVQLSMQGEGQVTLLQQLTNILAERSDLKIQARIGFMILLCTWLAECSVAVSQFLSNPASIPFITAQIEHHSSTDHEHIIRGLCATLLGICVAYHDGSTMQYMPETLRQLINHRIGHDTFNESIGHISSSELFTRAAKSPPVSADSLEMLCFDYSFTTLFKKVYDDIQRSLDPSAPSPVAAASQDQSSSNGPSSAHNINTSIEDHDSIVTSYKELIRDQDEELTSLREKYSAVERARSQESSIAQQQLAVIQNLQGKLAMYEQAREHSGTSGGGESRGGEREEVDSGEAAELQSRILSLERVQASQRQEIASKDTEIQRLQLSLESARANSQQSPNESLKHELAQLRDEILQLRADNEALKVENDTLDGQLGAAQQQVLAQQQQQQSQPAILGQEQSLRRPSLEQDQSVDLQQQLKKLQVAYQEMKEKNEVLEKEQEDLLILLAEHDARNKRYRALLLEHNVELSEEEEEEEEEDEEEEEEEDGD